MEEAVATHALVTTTITPFAYSAPILAHAPVTVRAIRTTATVTAKLPTMEVRVATCARPTTMTIPPVATASAMLSVTGTAAAPSMDFASATRDLLRIIATNVRPSTTAIQHARFAKPTSHAAATVCAAAMEAVLAIRASQTTTATSARQVSITIHCAFTAMQAVHAMATARVKPMVPVGAQQHSQETLATSAQTSSKPTRIVSFARAISPAMAMVPVATMQHAHVMWVMRGPTVRPVMSITTIIPPAFIAYLK